MEAIAAQTMVSRLPAWTPKCRKVCETAFISQGNAKPLPRGRCGLVASMQAKAGVLREKDAYSVESNGALFVPERLKTSEVPVLSNEEILRRMRLADHAAWPTYKAMYASTLGGIVTDPAFMVIPIDDHMVHRGHGVFDTTALWNRHLYELDAHLDRLLRSASNARLRLPFTREHMRSIIIQTAAASGCDRGFLRFWISSGPGGFGLSVTECPSPSFYVMVQEVNALKDHSVGGRVITSTVPMKAPAFATVKNVNYLPNVMVLAEAEEQGAVAGIWIDSDGNVAEGPNMNVAFVTAEGELLVPSFDKILSGCTILRTISLLKEAMLDSGCPVKKVTVGPVTEATARSAAEMILFSSTLYSYPVVEWDGNVVGNGKPGVVCQYLHRRIVHDLEHGPAAVRTPVP